MTENVVTADPVAIDPQDLIDRISEHHARENGRLVTALSMSQAECAALRRMLAEIHTAAVDKQEGPDGF